jgi:hypothetical protein
LTFPDAGTFNYICALHIFLGQTGQIEVAAGPASTAPPTDHGALASSPPSDGPPWLAFGLLAALAVVVAGGTLALRRR